MTVAGGGDDAREVFDKNRRSFTELYADADPEAIAADVRRGRDAIEESRRLWVGDQLFWGGELIPRLAGAHVLEIGCGRGDTAMRMLQLGAARVTALEINDSTEALVHETARLLGFEDRIDVRIGDFFEMELPEHGFD